MLNFEINYSYPWGRQKKNWFDNTRSGLDKLRLSTSLALDRGKWRTALSGKRMTLN